MSDSMPGVAELMRWRGLASVLWLAALLAFESARPAKPLFASVRVRFAHGFRNIALGSSNAILTALLFATAWKATADWSSINAFGLAHRLENMPGVGTAAALLLFDAWTYGWHRLNHRIPLLWRFHRMHHSDSEMDATTANRFHPGEIVLSSLLRLPLIALLGLEFIELLAYETVLLAVVQWHHSNLMLPPSIDRLFRVLVVTPAMHKVHHSRMAIETNSDYSALLSVWDRLFRSFRLRDDPRAIRFGLEGFDAPSRQSLAGLLITPFKD